MSKKYGLHYAKDTSLPDGVRWRQIPGCRPQDAEHDCNITLTTAELDELAHVGTIPEHMIENIYEQLMEEH